MAMNRVDCLLKSELPPKYRSHIYLGPIWRPAMLCHFIWFDSFDKTLDIKPPYKHIVISSLGPERKTGVQQKEKLNIPTPSLLGNRSELILHYDLCFLSF
jgi:hypothetical protein